MMLEIKDLTKKFGGVYALNKVTFKIKKGSITTLIGPNGSGKSTLFNILSGIVKKDFGTIIYANKEINNLSPEQISNLGISRLFQKSQLFENLSVLDNLLISLNTEDTYFWNNLLADNEQKRNHLKIIDHYLNLVGLESVKYYLACELSYGQKRLVEIIRAILNPHELLILDEPVAGVNPKIKKIIFEIIQKHKIQGKTILLIEHDMSFALKLSDEVIVLDEGKLIARDSPNNIIENKEVIKAYFGDSNA